MLSIAQLILKNLKKNDRDDERRKAAASSRHQLPSQIAAACEIPIKYERLSLAFGRVVYLAEAFLQPPGITVNLTAVEKLLTYAGQAPDEYRVWFTETALLEVIIAHELYHILAQRPSSRLVEAQAHDFAQALTGLSFAPLVYEEILRQTTEWTTNNTTWELTEDRVTQLH